VNCLLFRRRIQELCNRGRAKAAAISANKRRFVNLFAWHLSRDNPELIEGSELFLDSEIR
jgi:hypothetical protein